MTIFYISQISYRMLVSWRGWTILVVFPWEGRNLENTPGDRDIWQWMNVTYLCSIINHYIKAFEINSLGNNCHAWCIALKLATVSINSYSCLYAVNLFVVSKTSSWCLALPYYKYFTTWALSETDHDIYIKIFENLQSFKIISIR